MVLVVSFPYEEGFQLIYVGTGTGIGSFPGCFLFFFLEEMILCCSFFSICILDFQLNYPMLLSTLD